MKLILIPIPFGCFSSRKSIDPSEIIIENDGTVRNDTSRINPWIRFVARMFDYSLFIVLLWGVHRAIPGSTEFGRFESWIPFEYLLWIPVEAALLWVWGKTPGKWLLKIELRQGWRKRPDYLSAIRRSYHVWLRGLGMGIPFISAICLLVAYQRLKIFHLTSWDKDDHFQILHRPVSRMRLGFAVSIAILGFWFYFHEKNLSPF